MVLAKPNMALSSIVNSKGRSASCCIRRGMGRKPQLCVLRVDMVCVEDEAGRCNTPLSWRNY